MVLLDLIRYNQHLCGTKIGCREGDCGACTVLIGELKDDTLHYSSATSCLTPIGNANGKHIVTVEGINMKALNPIQQAMYEESGTQCGFCTPGFVMSLAGFCLSEKEPSYENAIASIDGNICRCTGYKSIERAAARITTLMSDRKDEDAISFVTEKEILPVYFKDIKKRLRLLSSTFENHSTVSETKQFVGGGTDLYVQKHDEMTDASIRFMLGNTSTKGIIEEKGNCIIGGASTVTELGESTLMQQYFPQLKKYIKLISSTPIRNIATIAGNFVNASPIGDLTIFFLALDAQLLLSDGTNKRTVSLRKFYKAYKQLDKTTEEFIEQVSFKIPSTNSKFNFEKVSKRTHLDIASVNTAFCISTSKDDMIEDASLSAGGVGPIPKYLEQTSSFLKSKPINLQLITDAIDIAQTEVTPISDARGSEAYKRLLLGQLIKAHFLKIFGIH